MEVVEKRSKNYYDTLLWIEKCIKSCNNIRQFLSMRKLLVAFRNSKCRKIVMNSEKDREIIKSRMDDYRRLEDLLFSHFANLKNKKQEIIEHVQEKNTKDNRKTRYQAIQYDFRTARKWSVQFYVPSKFRSRSIS